MEAKQAGNLARRLEVVTHPALLVVDEIGDRLPAGEPGRRHSLLSAGQRASRTSFDGADVQQGLRGHWGRVLGNEVMAAALIDRLLHHCHIVNIRGNSYRMRAHQNLLLATAEQRGEGGST